MHYITRVLLLFCCLFIALVSKGQAVANFTASPTAGCAPLVVNFYNSSSGATSYSWNFGNNTALSTQNSPSTTYLNPGTYTVTLTATGSSGSNSKTMTITVYNTPTVSFSANDTSVCPGVAVTFTNTSNPNTPGTVLYNWDFGDGTSSSAQNPTHTFPSQGYYNITLTVTNGQGCSSTYLASSYIHILSGPSPNFTATNTTFCHTPSTAYFIDATSGQGPFFYQWSFGDGGTSTATNPSHTYNAIGSYNVKLVVKDINGCKDSITQPAFITLDSLSATFTAPASACIYDSVNFQNTSANSNVSSSWAFGDGGTSTFASPTHVYNSAGTYNVRLVIYNGSCYDTVYHTIVINPEPIASFTSTPLSPCPPPVTLQFNSTVPPGSSYQWYFGDGGTSLLANPSHPYTGHRIDTVQLVVTNTNGCKDTVTRYDTIRNILSGAFANDSFGCIPLNVSFHAINQTNVPSTQTYPYPVTSYTWNFGDGSATSSAATPTHPYTVFGTYHAWVLMTFSNGCSIVDSIHITVGTPIAPSFTDSPTHICAGRTVKFTSTGTLPNTATLLWTFGDGLTSNNNPTVHPYNIPGIFSVTLYTFNNGCMDSLTKTNIITVDSPAAFFPLQYLCPPPHTGVAFQDSAIGATSILWVFSDGDTSSQLNPTHYFPSLGNWTAELTTYNSNSGCRDTLSKPIHLYALDLSLTANDTAMCVGDTVTLTPTITGGNYDYYFWGINSFPIDSIFGPPQPFKYAFNNSGIYNIQLYTVYNTFCLDTFSRPAYILVAKPVDSFYAVPPIGCRPLSVIFSDSSKDVPGTYIVNHFWNFGDLTSGNVQAADTNHLYPNNGSYDVEEIVTDNLGCKDTLLRPAYVNVHHPVAAFSVATFFPCIGFNLTFNNSSSGSIQTYSWSFGDGTSSNQSTPTHAYNDTGIYQVLLTVTDSFSCTDTSSVTLAVTRPHAAFTVSDTSGICIPLVAHFTNMSTGITGSYWTFGNGNISLANNPVNSYTVPNNYTVRLIVVNAHGCTDTAARQVNLYGYTGSFSYSPLIGCKPLTVNFTANVTNIDSLVWDFADGTVTSPSHLLTTSHTYTTPGAYVPKLILSDTSGCSASSAGADTIKIDDVVIGYNTNPNPVCIHDDVQFIDTSKSLFAVISSHFWKFDDGTDSYIADPLHTYNDTGTFPVTLVMSDNLGCRDTLLSYVTVHPLPVFTVSSDTIICLGDSAHLLQMGLCLTAGHLPVH